MLPGLYRELGELSETGQLVDVSDHELCGCGKIYWEKADRNRKIYNGMLKTYYYQFLGQKPPKKHGTY